MAAFSVAVVGGAGVVVRGVERIVDRIVDRVDGNVLVPGSVVPCPVVSRAVVPRAVVSRAVVSDPVVSGSALVCAEVLLPEIGTGAIPDRFAAGTGRATPAMLAAQAVSSTSASPAAAHCRRPRAIVIPGS